MPPECWPRWRGRSCISRQSFANCRYRRSSGSRSASRRCAAIVSRRIDELELAHQLREAIDLVLAQREHLADVARGAAPAIRDDVGRHRGAERAVALVHVLNDALALIAARQIEIDVRPLAALLREKALEQQIHADRIDGRDAERVADGAVGRRPAALHENPLPPAEADEVPDDEEVAGEVELLDELQLARDLRARAVVIRAIAIARADLRDAPQERDLRLAGRHRVVGKAITEIRERELEPLGQRLGARQRLRQIREQPRHHRRRFQIALGVRGDQRAGLLEHGLVPQTGEHVVERTRRRRRRTARRSRPSPAPGTPPRDRAASR